VCVRLFGWGRGTRESLVLGSFSFVLLHGGAVWHARLYGMESFAGMA